MPGESGLDSLLGTRFEGLCARGVLPDQVGGIAARLWEVGLEAIREAHVPVPLEVFEQLEDMASEVRDGTTEGSVFLDAVRVALHYDDFFVLFVRALEAWHLDGSREGDDEPETVVIRTEAEASTTTSVGKTVGPFTLLELVGRGGSGEVYRAKQAILDREVALKLLRPMFEAEESMIARFQNEARAAAKLRHPNIVRVIDMSRDPESGAYYIAFEFVEGPSLRQLLRDRGTLPEREAVALAADVARALQCAWEHGIVHRDVKPANILIGLDGVPKLADLGLAKRLDSNTRMTTMGLVMGTPHYIAPEQALGEEVDARADLYSLGVTLFQCLTGRLPFKARTAIGVITQHVNLDVPDPRIFRPEISKDTVDLLSWLCARDLDHRYPNPREAAESLERIAADQPPLPPSTLPPEARRDESVPISQEEVARRMSHRSRFWEGSELLGVGEAGDADASLPELEEPLTPPEPTRAQRERDQWRKAKPPTMVLSDDMLRAYRIARRLSRGADGLVYEVEVLGQQSFEDFNDPVTLAVIKLGIEREATRKEGLIYSLPDRRLVRLLDQGVHNNKRPYMILERLFPPPARRLRRTAHPATALDLYINLLASLRGLHFRRKMPLVLCDVNPECIHLRLHCPHADMSDEAYQERLAHGAYEAVFANLSSAQHREVVDAAGGQLRVSAQTPIYLAPESIPGSGEDVAIFSTKSDVYGLTLCFYELLSGLRPYEHLGLYEREGGEQLKAILDAKRAGLQPWDPALLERYSAEKSGAIEEVLEAGLERDPERRPGTNALLRRCQTLFRVHEVERPKLSSVDDPRLGLALRQGLFRPYRPGHTRAYRRRDTPHPTA